MDEYSSWHSPSGRRPDGIEQVDLWLPLRREGGLRTAPPVRRDLHDWRRHGITPSQLHNVYFLPWAPQRSGREKFSSSFSQFIKSFPIHRTGLCYYMEPCMLCIIQWKHGKYTICTDNSIKNIVLFSCFQDYILTSKTSILQIKASICCPFEWVIWVCYHVRLAFERQK